MYGYRGRIGVVLPADNAVMEPEFARLAPDGVSSHVVRLQKMPREEMPAGAAMVASAFAYTRIDVVGYMCAASSFMAGPDANQRLVDDIGKAAGGVPGFSASTSMVDALKVLGARKVAVLAPHPAEIVQQLESYLVASGLDVTGTHALGFALADINDAVPETIFRAARRLELRDADALFIAATNFRAIDVIELLEADLGVPVVTSNQAAMYKALLLMGVRSPIKGYGKLLRDHV